MSHVEIIVDHVCPQGPTVYHLASHPTVRNVRNALSASGKMLAKISIATERSPDAVELQQLGEGLCRFVAEGHRPPMGDSFKIGARWQAVVLDRSETFNAAGKRCVRARFSVVPSMDGWDGRELAEIFYDDSVEKLELVEGRRRG